MAPATQVGNVSTYTCGYDPSAPSPGVGLSASINASFSGDTTYAAKAASPYTQVFSGSNSLTTFTVSSVTNPTAPGSYATLKANLTGADGTPTGSVSFYDASSASPSTPVTCSGGYSFTGGVATCYYIPPIAYGTAHVITATYSGNVDYGFANGFNSITQNLT